MSEKKKYYNTILDVRLKDCEDKETGRKWKQPYLQLAKGVTIHLNGQKLDLNKDPKFTGTFMKQLSELKNDLKYLLDEGHIDQAKHDADEEYLKEKQIQLALKLKV